MKEKMSDAVKFIELDKIKYGKRFREDLGDLDVLSESIKDKGVLQPITVTPDLELLAGERRVKAAKAAGLSKIPALIRESTEAVDKREIELIENVFRKDFTWAERASLIQEIDRLYKSKNVDWSKRKTAQLLNKSVANVMRTLQLAEAVEVIPELATVKTADEALKIVKKFEEDALVHELRSRQERILDKGIKASLKVADSNYRIGDLFKEIASLRSDGPIDVIECDPPYGINLHEVSYARDSATSKLALYNEIPRDSYPEFLQKLCKELYRVAGRDCWLIFWFGPTWQHEVLSTLRSVGWDVDEIPAIWVKDPGQTNSPEVRLARSYETFYLCRKGKPVLHKRGRSNVFAFRDELTSARYHSTQKPLDLMEEVLNVVAFPMQTVFVPFLGSGVTIRAAYKCGMKAFGYEISDKYRDKFMLAVEQDARNLNTEDE